jgi:hypothetical protein
MARLLIKSGQQCGQVIELNLGVNRLGRSAANDFQLEDPTISANHCDIILGDEGVVVRDKGSTNGTFLDGRRTKEAGLQAGQTLRLGGVELFVETADVTVAIPRIEVRQAAPPVVLADGTMLCPRHASARATVLNLCPFCSHPCVSTTIEKPKKKRLLRILVETVRLPFLRASGRPDRRV